MTRFFRSLFGLFTREEKQRRLDKRIAEDPVLKELDEKITKLNKKAAERMKGRSVEDDVDDIFTSLRIDVEDREDRKIKR